MPGIESLLQENRIFPPSDAVKARARISGRTAYETMCEHAKRDPNGFWAELAQQHLVWNQPFTQTLDESQAPFYRWFSDGTLNASANCLDRHIGTPVENKTALIFEDDDGAVKTVTYAELLKQVCQWANALKAEGIQAGDRVVIYMPMSIEGIVAMQACARIGATHSVVFGGFSAKSLNERIADMQAKLVITANFQRRGGKQLALKSVVDEALMMDGAQSVKRVWVYERTTQTYSMQSGRDRRLSEVLANQSTDCPPAEVSAEHPLFILYTSGSTGKPKGIQHSTAGYLLWAKLTMLWVFDIQNEDTFWCTADIGWITGHSYVVYGPMACGATQVIFEGVPMHPKASRFWQLIEKHQVSVFYTAPTAIRSLMKANAVDESTHPRHFDLSSLRLLGTVGEPINPEAWMWYYEQVGQSRCPVLDTFWQTETGGHVIAPLPGATDLVPGSCTLPLPGIAAQVVDETGATMSWGTGGLLVIERPWPGMARTLWGDPERFKKTYFPDTLGGKLYLAGDGAVRDPKTGYFRITGRIDDVLNVSGHRLGTMEIESALVSATDLVAEAAVVGRPDEITGEAIVAFVVPKGPCPTGEEAVAMAQHLRDWVAKSIGAIAKPKEIRFGENLPKTRSGKIMRRLLRALAQDQTITQDTTTLENPQILEQLARKH